MDQTPSSNPGSGSGSREDSAFEAARITRLEEAVGFMDHHSSQLSDQIAAISREVSDLSGRMRALERRLLDLTDAVTDAPPVVPPPHSAGPDIPREPL